MSNLYTVNYCNNEQGVNQVDRIEIFNKFAEANKFITNKICGFIVIIRPDNTKLKTREVPIFFNGYEPSAGNGLMIKGIQPDFDFDKVRRC